MSSSHKWNTNDLRSQYSRAKANGWIPFFVASGDAIPDDEIDAATLMAIASRETNMRSMKGDFRNGRYNGFGIMQLDIGSHPQWIASGAWQNVREAIAKGADALDEKRQQILDGRGQTLDYKGKKFTGDPFTTAQLKKIALAAYNSGLGAYYSFSTDPAKDPDARTTGKDYGDDVLSREKVFREWLTRDGFLGNGNDLAAPETPGSTGTAAGATTGEAPLVAPVPTVSVANAAAVPVVETPPEGGQTVNVEAGGMAQITSPPADQTAAPTPGGGPDDPAKKANNESLVSKLQGWAAKSLGTGGAIGAITAGISSLTGLDRDAQVLIVLIFGGVLVLGALVFGLFFAWAAYKDHELTREHKANPGLINTR